MAIPDDDPAVTYQSYLRIPELLDLQSPRSDEHDELLFIVIHQVYELWFKQVIAELDHAVGLLDADDRVRSGHTLARVLRILKVLVSQLDVLETMTPLEFGSFRDRLATASGFQSVQFRRIEAVVGLDPPPGAVLSGDDTSSTLWAALVAHLARSGYPAETADDHGIDDALLAAYRTDPSAAELCERFVDLDEGLQEWRYRHLKMVQRTIGTREGTGGSSGAAYLATTLRPAFPRLWAIRSRF